MANFVSHLPASGAERVILASPFRGAAPFEGGGSAACGGGGG